MELSGCCPTVCRIGRPSFDLHSAPVTASSSLRPVLSRDFQLHFAGFILVCWESLDNFCLKPAQTMTYRQPRKIGPPFDPSVLRSQNEPCYEGETPSKSANFFGGFRPHNRVHFFQILVCPGPSQITQNEPCKMKLEFS